jgi:hypothetical protein
MPPALARKIVADFSSPAAMAASLKPLVAAINSSRPASEFTWHDEFEMFMERMTLRSNDARRAAVLCSNIRSTVRTVLLTAYRLNGRMPYGQVPALRVLLFTVHEAFQCLRLQVWVDDQSAVIHCRHRFTIDARRQEFLNPAAQAWHAQALHVVNYSTEYERDPDAYIEEAVRYGFDREKVANIVGHVASSVSIPLAKVKFSPVVGSPPAVVCIDSERTNVFLPATHDIIVELIQEAVNDHNAGRRSVSNFRGRDFSQDNRGIIDECGN